MKKTEKEILDRNIKEAQASDCTVIIKGRLWVEKAMKEYAQQFQQPISAERKQELFNYFYDNHDFRLLESDYEEIDAIYGGFKQPTPTDEKVRETIKKGFNQLYIQFYQVWKYYDKEPNKDMVLSNFKADLDLLAGFLNTYQPTEQQNWISVDPKQPNSMPDEDLWLFNMHTQEVEFVPKDQFVDLGIYSHYKIAVVPEFKTQNK